MYISCTRVNKVLLLLLFGNNGNSPDISQSQSQDVYHLQTCSQCFLFEEACIIIQMQCSFVTSDWVSIFLEFESCKAVSTHFLWSGMWIWPVCVRQLEIKVVNPQARVSQLRHESGWYTVKLFISASMHGCDDKFGEL